MQGDDQNDYQTSNLEAHATWGLITMQPAWVKRWIKKEKEYNIISL